MNRFLVPVTIALTAGCVSVPRDAGFTDVRIAVADRTGRRIAWDRGGAADREVAASIHALLEREIGVDDAVQVALLNNQGLQATYEDLGVAQAELVEAGLLKNPTFSASVRFPKYRALPFDIDIAQSFLDLFVLPLRKRVAGKAFEAAKLRVVNEVLMTVASTKTSFYRAQGAAQLVEMRQSIVSATEASLDAAQSLHDAGNITDLALAGVRALHEQARIDLAKATRDAQDAREELGTVMGLWGTEAAWKIPPRLPAPPAAEFDPAAVESLALARRTDLGAAASEVEVSTGELSLARKMAFGSDVSVGGHLSRETDGATSAGPGVQLSVPLFNQGQPAIAAAEARVRQARRRYAAMMVQVRADVRRARNKVLAARDLAETYARVVLPLRHQIVQQNQLQFNAMQVGVFELLAVRQAEIDAGREYVEALQEYWVARVELERLVGGRLPDSSQPATAPASAASRPAEPPAPADAQQHPHHHAHEK